MTQLKIHHRDRAAAAGRALGRLAMVVMLSGMLPACTTLPDPMTFVTQTEQLVEKTNSATEKTQAIFQSALVTSLPPEAVREAIAEARKFPKPGDEQCWETLRAKCRKVKPTEPGLMLKCSELNRRQLAVFGAAASSYANSLKKIVDAGNSGADSANALIASLNGVSEALRAVPVIDDTLAKILVRINAAIAKARAQKKLRAVLPETQKAIAEISQLLRSIYALMDEQLVSSAQIAREDLDGRDGQLRQFKARLVRERERLLELLGLISTVYYGVNNPESEFNFQDALSDAESQDPVLERLNASSMLTGGNGADALKLKKWLVTRNGLQESCPPDEECVGYWEILGDRYLFWIERSRTVLTEIDAYAPELDASQQRQDELENQLETASRLLRQSRQTAALWKSAHQILAESTKKPEGGK